jgi:hypothetical protein
VSTSRIVLVTFLFFLIACKAKKQLPADGSIKKCRLDYKSAKTLTHLLKQNQVNYTTLSRKLKANMVVGDNSTDFTVHLRMKKDSIIWASLTILGIEGVRFIATKDSIKFFNRDNSSYFVGAYDTLSHFLNTEIDLEILQSLLVGNSVEFYEEDEKLRSGIDSCYYLLGTIRKRKLHKVMDKGKELKEPAQNIWLMDNSFKIDRILFKDFASNREFDARFSEFLEVPIADTSEKKITIPGRLSYHIKSEKNSSITLEGNKVIVNTALNFPFKIPEGYEAIQGQ